MAELAMLADIQRTVYPEKVTRQLHVMAQNRECSPVIDRRSNHEKKFRALLLGVYMPIYPRRYGPASYAIKGSPPSTGTSLHCNKTMDRETAQPAVCPFI